MSVYINERYPQIWYEVLILNKVNKTVEIN